MDKRNFKESLKFNEKSSIVPKVDEYSSQIFQYASKKLENDACEIATHIRKMEEKLKEDENSEQEQQEEKTRAPSSSRSYFYSLSFEISHLEKKNNKSFEKSFKEICRKYKVNFDEITTVIQDLQELQNSENIEEVKEYMQKLDDRALQYFKEKNEEEKQQ